MHARTHIADLVDAAVRTCEEDKSLDAYVRILTVDIAFSDLTCSAKCGSDREGAEE